MPREAAAGEGTDVRAHAFRALAPADREALLVRLVGSARAGDSAAWDELFECYVALLWSIAYRHGLHESDAGDVVQNTWLRLVEHIGDIREPARLGSWLATTAQREALRCVAQNARVVPSADEAAFDGPDRLLPDVDERLLAEELAGVAYAALGTLPPAWRLLVEKLTQDPAPDYETISADLQMPVGSIGPTRGRSMRRMQAIISAY